MDADSGNSSSFQHTRFLGGTGFRSVNAVACKRLKRNNKKRFYGNPASISTRLAAAAASLCVGHTAGHP